MISRKQINVWQLDSLNKVIEEEKKKIDYVFTLESVKDKLDDLYQNGNPKGYDCGFADFHEHYSILPGKMTFINGAPDSGKTYFWFDSHSRNDNGFISSDGKAVLLRFTDVLSIVFLILFCSSNACLTSSSDA